MVTRFNAQTGLAIGTPTQMSSTRIGRNAFAQPSIAYNSTDGTTSVVWMEDFSTISGRTVNSDLTTSEIYPVINPTTAGYSSGFLNPTLVYSSSTNTFMVTGEDQDGGSFLVEYESSGFIYDTTQPLAPPTAQGGAYGNFWPTLVATDAGAVVLASQGYHNVSSVIYNSSFAGSNLPAATVNPSTSNPTPVDTSSLPALINQIYIWSLGVAGLLALLMMILGGYTYMTAAGNAQQAAKGKDYILSSLIGIALLLCSYLLLKTINPQFTQLNVSSINTTQTPPGQ
jgi:hypothetical protein